MKFSKKYLEDRIHACWLGKNIGGTIGTPYEGGRELLDIEGFASKPGEPLPNDDLDLQLAWLRAIDELGPEQVDNKVLGEYWVSYVTPHWNEYGIGKANMKNGIVPPLSGELFNEEWKHSNGAWIRTEIWATLFPAQIEKAVKYAFYDASVDHGFGEGTYAAIFVEAMECAAFVISDMWTLLEIGLSKIPADCRVARAVRLVMDEYKKGTDWKKVRELVLEDSRDLGWFQAPGNVAFTVLGLLYGEGDFKKSIILAVNCGDDTDCTGATAGALLGIKDGMAGIPADWAGFIGDEIKTKCLTQGHGEFPASCKELTDCVMNLLPVTLRTKNSVLVQKGVQVELCDENDFSGVTAESLMGRQFVESFAGQSRLSFTSENVYVTARVEFDADPIIAPLGSVTGKITLLPHVLPEQKNYHLRWLLPAGWSVQSKRNLFTSALNSDFRDHASTAFTLTAGEDIDAVNRIVLEITVDGRPTPLLTELVILA